MSRAGSSRWSPTPEQLMILEELYRSGIRTPSASQIQHITTHLCFYGRIEGKNVFYWFQNHKARDRQKLRRKLNMQHHHLQQQQQQQQQHYFLGAFDSSHVLLSQGEAEETSEKATTGCRYCIMHDPKTQSVMEKIEKSSLSSSSLCKNYGCSVMDVNIEASSSYTTRPLKTLDLFPTTSTKLKEEESTIISTTFTDKQLYHSVSVHQSI